jgi:hypothetical protein
VRKGPASDLSTRQARVNYCVRVGPRFVHLSLDAALSRSQRAAVLNAYRKDVQRMRHDQA